MSLAKLLKRGYKGMPSLVTTVDIQLMKESPVYSLRAVNAALFSMQLATKSGNKEAMMKAFLTLKRMMEAPRSRVDKFIHVSELERACPRRLFYRVTGIEPVKTPSGISPQLQRIFDVGTWWHSYIQDLLLAAGVLDQAEVRVFNPDKYLLGHNDGEGTLAGRKFILEIKTINSHGFLKVSRDNTPKYEHKYQAGVYAKERNIDLIIFLYINKDTSEIKEFFVEDKTIKNEVFEAYEKLNHIVECINTPTPPDRICKTSLDTEATVCAYCAHCFKKVK